MRITQSMMRGNILRNINNNLAKINETSQQISTGKTITKPSDNPIASEQVLTYRNSLASNEQYTRNAEKASTWLDEMDMALNQGIQVFHRAKELTVQGSNDSYSQSQRENMAMEVDALASQLREIANLEINGLYVFNGQKTDEAPFSNEAPYTAKSTGTGRVVVELARGLKMPLNMEAEDAFGKNGENVFKTLSNISDKLRNGTSTEISDNLEKLDEHLNTVLSAVADVGARKTRVDLINNRLQEQKINVTKLLSKVEDVNIAEAVMNMKLHEQVYEASLSSSSKVMQMSLMNFLR
jgi:flagellar hook-associated protein 3 FlgL